MENDDLDRVSFVAATGAGDEPSPIPTLGPYDPAADREQVRGKVALTLLALFCLLVLGLTGAALTNYLAIDTLEKVAAVLLAPVTGLLGAVIGFYYGEHAGGR